MIDKPYEQWLTERREISPPVALTGKIMSQVAELEQQRSDIWWLRLICRLERSRTARWTVYGGALAIGILPFVFLAHIAQFVTF